MTVLAPDQAATPSNGEETFGIDEIFYSRTDPRGVIRSGNDVFRRVSGLPWDRLIGAPHNIVRHPDTPRAVFRILWDIIQSGRPAAAYVKNRSANGNWYWVLATLLPEDDGYVSFRIKPTSPLFDKVRSLYAEICRAEVGQNLSPDRAAELLEARLLDLGFSSYADFMTKAMDLEQTARDQALGRKISPEIRALTAVGDALQETLVQQGALLRDFDALQAIPNNMRIIASRLEPSGGPVSAISENYKFASTEISRRLIAFASGKENLCHAMVRVVAESVLLTRSARLLAEYVTLARRSEDPAAAEEMRFFSRLEQDYIRRAESAMKRAVTVSGELYQSSAELRRMMLGLDTIRVMGRVESGRMGAAGAGLGATIDQLDIHHGEIAAKLQDLMNISARIRAGVTIKAEPVAA